MWTLASPGSAQTSSGWLTCWPGSVWLVGTETTTYTNYTHNAGLDWWRLTPGGIMRDRSRIYVFRHYGHYGCASIRHGGHKVLVSGPQVNASRRGRGALELRATRDLEFSLRALHLVIWFMSKTCVGQTSFLQTIRNQVWQSYISK